MPVLGAAQDVRFILAKKELQLLDRVDSEEFVKIAGRVQRKASKRHDAQELERIDSVADEADPAVGAAVAAIDELLGEPEWAAKDEAPARIAPDLLLGAAAHAADLVQLEALGVTAVLNLAPQSCDDPVGSYAAREIGYTALEADDFSDYPLLELHLEQARELYAEVAAAGGTLLVHCFAGVNRSAAIAVALLMLTRRTPLVPTLTSVAALRPFVLTNRSFRRQLAELAQREGLLGGEGGGGGGGGGGRSVGAEEAAPAAAPAAAAAAPDVAAEAAPEAAKKSWWRRGRVTVSPVTSVH